MKVNPFGILYNPLSVCRALTRMLANTPYAPEELTACAEQWVSFDHHGRFADRDADRCLEKINASLMEGADFLRRSRCLLITLGTAHAWFRRDSGLPVANCHKRPATEFDRRRLSVETITAAFDALFDKLFRVCPDLGVIFTVSPVRYWRDGAHGNNLGKAALLLAVDQLVERYPACTYFPSYEIVIDELRDYRFYGEDMVHPSDVAVAYVWRKFREACLDSETAAAAEEAAAIAKAFRHRPTDTGAPEYARFLRQLQIRLDSASGRFPTLDFSAERAGIQQRLAAYRTTSRIGSGEDRQGDENGRIDLVKPHAP